MIDKSLRQIDVFLISPGNPTVNRAHCRFCFRRKRPLARIRSSKVNADSVFVCRDCAPLVKLAIENAIGLFSDYERQGGVFLEQK